VLSYPPSIPVTLQKEIPSIQTLLLHLEGKGRKPATLEAIMKGLKALAVRADLRNTVSVELAIARYIKQNGRPITNNYKSKLCDCYQHYCKFYKIDWEKPRTLYREKAMPSLEIESLIIIRLTKKQRRAEIANQHYQIKEMKQTIARNSEFIGTILTLLYK
jgi:hypothetical protein